MRNDPTEIRLHELAALEADTEGALELVTKRLSDRSAHVIARAVRALSELGLEQLLPELAPLFTSRIQDGAKRDPGCGIKKNIVQAYIDFSCEHEEDAVAVFREGITLVQLEPVFGGKVDSAPGLRGLCALGLLNSARRDVLFDVLPLLADSEIEARLGAVRAISSSGAPGGDAVLQLQVLQEREPEVVLEAMLGYLKARGARALPFALLQVDSRRDAIVEAIILAVGEARIVESTSWLMGLLEGTRSVNPDWVIRALSLVRRKEAHEALFQLARTESVPRVRQVSEALLPSANHEGSAGRLPAGAGLPARGTWQ